MVGSKASGVKLTLGPLTMREIIVTDTRAYSFERCKGVLVGSHQDIDPERAARARAAFGGIRAQWLAEARAGLPGVSWAVE